MEQIRIFPVCRGRRDLFQKLVDYWDTVSYYIPVNSFEDADVIWVEWANEQSVYASQKSPKKNVIVRICGSEYYQEFWKEWGSQIARVISINAVFKTPFPTIHIPNFVDTEFWRSLTRERSRTIAMLGDFTYRKGQIGLLRMLTERSKFFEKVLMVGPLKLDNKGYEAEARGNIMQLKYLAEDQGVELEIRDVQSPEDVREIINSVSFVVSSSISEMCHRVMQEAMSCNTPVLIANWLGSKEVYPKELIYSNAKEFWSLVDNYPNIDLRQYVLDHFAREVILPQIDRVIKEVAEEVK